MFIHLRDTHAASMCAPNAHPGGESARTHDRPPLVWVIDDDDGVRHAVRLLLQSVGWRVRASFSAEDFLHTAHLDELDCLVLDLHLPGKDGTELLSALALSRRTLPVVITTAFPELAPPVTPAGMVRCVLRKPFEGRRLLEEIRRAIS